MEAMNIRLFGKTDSIEVQIIQIGILQSKIRTQYFGLKIEEKQINLTSGYGCLRLYGPSCKAWVVFIMNPLEMMSKALLAGSGANQIVFTTGLGTPTGNPIAPTVKSFNS